MLLLDLTSLTKSEQIASIMEGWRVLVPLILAMLTDRCFWFDVSCLSRNYNNIFQKALVCLPLYCETIFSQPPHHLS